MILCDTQQEVDLIVRFIGIALANGGVANAQAATQIITNLRVKQAEQTPEVKS